MRASRWALAPLCHVFHTAATSCMRRRPTAWLSISRRSTRVSHHSAHVRHAAPFWPCTMRLMRPIARARWSAYVHHDCQPRARPWFWSFLSTVSARSMAQRCASTYVYHVSHAFESSIERSRWKAFSRSCWRRAERSACPSERPAHRSKAEKRRRCTMRARRQQRHPMQSFTPPIRSKASLMAWRWCARSTTLAQ